jgi:hypothetical protein
VAYLTN